MHVNDPIFRIARIIVSILAGFFISINGHWDKFFKVIVTPSFYVAVGVSFGIAYLLLYLIHVVSFKLDQRLPWKTNLLYRIAVQLLLCFILPLALDLALAGIYINATGSDLYRSGFIKNDFPIIVIFFLLVNSFYVIYNLIPPANIQFNKHYPESPDSRHDEYLTVNYNGNFVRLHAAADILYFFREGKVVKVRTVSGVDYTIQKSISTLIEELPSAAFCQISRSVIVNAFALKGYSVLKRDKLQVRFKTIYHTSIKNREDDLYKVTKEYIENFKNHISIEI